jgi:hypothetical protein
MSICGFKCPSGLTILTEAYGLISTIWRKFWASFSNLSTTEFPIYFPLIVHLRVLFIEGPRSRFYGRTAALKPYCATLWRSRRFFCFSILMEHRWNEIDRGKPKYSEKNLFQCHFVHHKSHTDRPGIESGPPRWEAHLGVTPGSYKLNTLGPFSSCVAKTRIWTITSISRSY